jgi:DNA-binding NtrC family response regulator
VIDLYPLSDLPHLEAWIEGLGIEDLRHAPRDHAQQAVWTGRPFILAGDKASLAAWFKGLDDAARRVLRDHAYFWIVTSHRHFDHELIPKDRPTVLDVRGGEYIVIHDSVEFLNRFPRLAGLSREMHHLREEILRIGTGPSEPATPVLILGESGSGKEGTAQSLFEASKRKGKPGLHSIGGSSLKMEPGMALSELFGIEANIASGVRGRSGLMELYSDGGLFVDDFDTAPKVLQERLLRITSTPKGEQAKYRRVGGETDRQTNAWLIFATNHDVTEMLKKKRLRPDFFFRFEDRVLVVPALRERPADLPAIAQSLWSRLGESSGPALKTRPLPWRSLQDMTSRAGLQWNGNVRELSALLSLVASMCKMPQHRDKSTTALINQVLARGDSSMEWLGIVASKEFSNAPRTSSPVAQILDLDLSQRSGKMSGCEAEVFRRVGEAKWNELKLLTEKLVARKQDKLRVAFCRYMMFATKFEEVSATEAMELGEIEVTQALKQLRWLADSKQYLVESERSSRSKYIFKCGPYLSKPRDGAAETGQTT